MSKWDAAAQEFLTEANAIAAANRGRDGSAETIAAAADAIVHAVFGVSDRLELVRQELEQIRRAVG
jgi:hypothetical protein